ncbi:MAG: hypothetical protein M0R80_11075 [Proteobacteria bacterium]|jgi:hypothetical protein|nr:hypothetical protein [Pseudomonadota bacterium]
MTETLHLRRIALCILFACAAAPACDDSAKGADPDGGTDSDTDVDTDTDSDTDSDAEESWEGVEIDGVTAPTEYSVTVGFTGNPPAAEAGSLAIYALDSDVGALDVLLASYDEEERVATLTTAKQKLGVTYTLTVTPPAVGAEALAADFLSANTASFWVHDFGTGAEEQITAARNEVGESCVIYVQEGYFAYGAMARQNFDENVFPLETEMFIDAPDLDGNGKIVMLGLDGGGYYGGYFSPVNAYSNEQAMAWWGLHSNEMEIIHINVGYGDFDSGLTIVPHEFQHLLYQERHPENDWVDTYHNEGLAECAVRAVNGDYDQAIGYYFSDPEDVIGDGMSLVDWAYAQYENYVVAFMFWSYIAGQLGGVDAYSDIFDLDSGSPALVDEFLLAALGTDFGATQLDQMIAAFVQAETGAYGYEGLLDLGGLLPPHVDGGTTSVNLEPFAGSYFLIDQASVDYPGTQGPNVVYAGIDGEGAVDLAAPFDVGGGALVVLNTNLEFDEYPEEHSGPDVAASGGGKGPLTLEEELAPGVVSPTWTDPPPAAFTHPERLAQWRVARETRLGLR